MDLGGPSGPQRIGPLFCSLVLADNFSVDEVVPIEPAAIAAGSYIGTAALAGPDGAARAGGSQRIRTADVRRRAARLLFATNP